jgi:hypothetical protein
LLLGRVRPWRQVWGNVLRPQLLRLALGPAQAQALLQWVLVLYLHLLWWPPLL